MVCRAFDGDFLPGNSLKIFDSTDLDPFGFKNRSLFDVQFNVFMRDDRAGLQVSRIANTLQLITQTCAISADSVQDFLQRDPPCIDERSHHIGLITDTLFVCECADSNRAGRFDPGFSESPDDSQAGQDTVTTIESAGVYNGVNMGANHQWLLFVSTIYRRQCAII
ncbi:hypothetical protein BCR59_01620 [Klebsiella pneumoniae]|nr:hypothetical protein BCR59_01620 [Klebsiella pneumoniae]